MAEPGIHRLVQIGRVVDEWSLLTRRERHCSTVPSCSSHLVHDSRHQEESSNCRKRERGLWILGEGRDEFHLTATWRVSQQTMRQAAGRPIKESCSNRGKRGRWPKLRCLSFRGQLCGLKVYTLWFPWTPTITPYFPIPDLPWKIPIFAGQEKLRIKNRHAFLVPEPHHPSLLTTFFPLYSN